MRLTKSPWRLLHRNINTGGKSSLLPSHLPTDIPIDREEINRTEVSEAMFVKLNTIEHFASSNLPTAVDKSLSIAE